MRIRSSYLEASPSVVGASLLAEPGAVTPPRPRPWKASHDPDAAGRLEGLHGALRAVRLPEVSAQAGGPWGRCGFGLASPDVDMP